MLHVKAYETPYTVCQARPAFQLSSQTLRWVAAAQICSVWL